MRARLADSGRGRDVGRSGLALGLALAILGWVVFLIPLTETIAGYVEAAGLLLAFLSGPLGRARRSAAEGHVELRPGRVLFFPARGRLRADATRLAPFASFASFASRETIRARDVLGASTAAGPGNGVTLAIARASRVAEPTLLTLDSEADADEVRRVLGVGHHGRGAIAWRTFVARDERLSTVLSFALSVLVVWITATHRSEPSLISLTILALYALPVLLGLWAVRSHARRVLLTPHGVEIHSARAGAMQSMGFGYAEIAAVHATRAGLMLEIGLDHRPCEVPIALGRGPFAAMTSEERDHMVAQIDAAVKRARGATRPHEDASSRLETLRRRSGEMSTGETAAQWLARLDGIAASLLQPAGYRGAAIDAVDLWTVLEDPDADLELRCAAARVLTRQMNRLPIRVATAVAAAEPTVERKLRLAVESPANEADDVDFAAVTPRQAQMRWP